LRKKRVAEFDPARVEAISNEVYRERLDADSNGAVKRMLAKDGDDGTKMNNRARAYDSLTRSYLRVITKRMERE
jgi:hypothetical protein